MLDYTKIEKLMMQAESITALLECETEKELQKVDPYTMDAPWEVRHFAYVLRKFRNLMSRTGRDLKADLLWITTKAEVIRENERKAIVI